VTRGRDRRHAEYLGDPTEGRRLVPVISPTEIYSVCIQAGFTPDQAVTWTAIAMAESGGNTQAHNPHGENSWGLWQVNIDPDVRDNPWGDLTDPAANARAAYEISHGGTDMRPWTTTHASNAGTPADYREYMDEARAAAGGAYQGDFSGVSGYNDPNPMGGDEPGGPVGGAGGAGAGTGPAGPDSDTDGASDAFEMSKGTNPQVADSDLDGLTDGYELDHGLNALALDTDNDGLSDAFEVRLGSDPLKADSDGDGIGDAEEYALGRDPAHGVALGPDGQPLPVDATDSDGDGLSDVFEAALGTDIHLADTDGDGIGDAEEQGRGLDPTKADSDGDGILDGVDADPHMAMTVPGAGPLSTLATPVGFATVGGLDVPGVTDPDGPDLALATAPDDNATDLTHQFLDHALAQTGDDYVFGAEAAPDDADPGVFDCSELTQWAASQVGVSLPDGSWLQYLQLKEAGAVIPVDQAEHTPGALLFSFDREPTAAGGRPGQAHVAISLGDGTTIEARGRAYGVGSWDAGDRFQYAAIIPGLSDAPLADGEAGAGGGVAEGPAPDSDGDGAPDPYEMTMGTNPAMADSDTDGLTDGLEMSHGLDAHVVDTDGDGLSDAYELQSGGDALHADADGDGFTDAYELATLGDATFATTGVVLPSMPGQAAVAMIDSDDDGLSDPWESSLGTNPLHEDTDGDGWGDAMEVARGTDPLVPDHDDEDRPEDPEPP
jgi:cell wall-associated NlpC family hydrolase